MKTFGTHNYFVYILTNDPRTVLYTGVTNDLPTRINEHRAARSRGKFSFAGRYNCFNLIYYERFGEIEYAIEREKQIKGLSRGKKEKLISDFNPYWEFLDPFDL